MDTATTKLYRGCQKLLANVLDDEFKTSMGLVEESRYFDLFSRYVQKMPHLKVKILTRSSTIMSTQ